MRQATGAGCDLKLREESSSLSLCPATPDAIFPALHNRPDYNKRQRFEFKRARFSFFCISSLLKRFQMELWVRTWAKKIIRYCRLNKSRDLWIPIWRPISMAQGWRPFVPLPGAGNAFLFILFSGNRRAIRAYVCQPAGNNMARLLHSNDSVTFSF